MTNPPETLLSQALPPSAGELVVPKPARCLVPAREKSGEEHPLGARMGTSRIQPRAGSASSCLREGGRRDQLCRDADDNSRHVSIPQGLTPQTLLPVFFYPHAISQLKL